MLNGTSKRTSLSRLSALALALVAQACATPSPLDSATSDPRNREHDGVWSFRFDNDSTLFTDGNYSSGIQLRHLSPAVERLQEEAFSRRLTGWLAPLPGLGNVQDRHFVSYSFGQLIFTPESLKARNPPADALPYTGVLMFDTGVYARSPGSLTAYHLMLGVTGEPSLAEETQKTVHEFLNLERPRGWSHQSRDEALLNLSYERHQRVSQGTLGSGLAWDWSYNLGAAVGNYFTGLNSGLQARFGQQLPAELGSKTLFSGFESSSVPLHRPAPGASWHAFAELETYAVGRYLPVDGNLFQDGRSTDGEPIVASLALGLSFSWRSMSLSLIYTAISDIYENQSETTQVGSLTLDFFP